VVEDDDWTRYSIARLLTDDGFDVLQVPDYRKALTILEDGGSLDLLLTDLVLPGVNGFALARMARMRHHNLKVVYVTAYDDIPTSEAVGPIIRKPIEAETLLRIVQRTLQAA
jgi:two-component system cell cycle sensor histidine kinase/response regulator CckA